MTQYAAAIEGIAMPDRIKSLPISPKGMPVPWFVAWIGGVPDFRVVGPGKIQEAYLRKRCWVCGGLMGLYKAMTLGPMCAINRTISEPPSHRDCAIYSARACPFLANPRARRREAGLPEDAQEPAGLSIKRNPGAVAVWITQSYRPFGTPDGGVLFTFDDPVEVLWFAEGRPATRDEVTASIDSGIHLLEAEAEAQGPGAVHALARMRREAEQYLPKENANA
jgi:hypothetical protein